MPILWGNLKLKPEARTLYVIQWYYIVKYSWDYAVSSWLHWLQTREKFQLNKMKSLREFIYYFIFTIVQEKPRDWMYPSYLFKKSESDLLNGEWHPKWRKEPSREVKVYILNSVTCRWSVADMDIRTRYFSKVMIIVSYIINIRDFYYSCIEPT